MRIFNIFLIRFAYKKILKNFVLKKWKNHL